MRKLKHVKLFEGFINEGFHEDISGYTLLGNKDKQELSGFVVGDKVEFDHKNVRGEVIQTVGGEVTDVYTKDGKWAVVVRKENGTQVFGNDTNKFSDLKELRKSK